MSTASCHTTSVVPHSLPCSPPNPIPNHTAQCTNQNSKPSAPLANRLMGGLFGTVKGLFLFSSPSLELLPVSLKNLQVQSVAHLFFINFQLTHHLRSAPLYGMHQSPKKIFFVALAVLFCGLALADEGYGGYHGPVEAVVEARGRTGPGLAFVSFNATSIDARAKRGTRFPHLSSPSSSSQLVRRRLVSPRSRVSVIGSCFVQ